MGSAVLAIAIGIIALGLLINFAINPTIRANNAAYGNAISTGLVSTNNTTGNATYDPVNVGLFDNPLTQLDQILIQLSIVVIAAAATAAVGFFTGGSATEAARIGAVVAALTGLVLLFINVLIAAYATFAQMPHFGIPLFILIVGGVLAIMYYAIASMFAGTTSI